MDKEYQKELHFNNPLVNDVYDLVEKMPKIDLHRHLMGSVRVETVYDIYKEYGLNFPYVKQRYNVDKVREKIVLNKKKKSLNDFLNAWRPFNRIIVSKDVVERIVIEAIEDAYNDNLIYVEFLMSPYGLNGNNKIQTREFLEALSNGKQVASKRFPSIDVNFIISLPRHHVGNLFLTEMNYYYDRVIEEAMNYKDILIVGFDLTGNEAESREPGYFRKFFDRTKELGFKTTVHAGETGPSEYIKEAITQLHADRIGHGVSIGNDKELIEYFVDKQIPLEMCITSNYITNVIREKIDHPLKRYYDLGLNVTINTDDPIMFDTTMSKEIQYTIKYLGLSVKEIHHINYNSAKASFSTDTQKQKLVDILDAWAKSNRIL